MNDKIRVPVVLGFNSPFRLFLRDGEKWEPTLDEINDRSYDYVKLHRLSEFIDVGIAPFSLGVCFDGGLVLPALEQFQNPDIALRTFNRFLCECLLGGLYCEAIVPDDVVAGWMSEEAYSRIGTPGTGQASSLHSALRTKHVGPLQSMALLKPEVVTVSDLIKLSELGRKHLTAIGHITPETLLYGATFIARGQWSEALIHLWTTVEQIVEEIWKEHVMNKVELPEIPKKRRDAFLQDHRSWPVSVKLELLFQKELLPEEVYTALDKARAARNNFAHNGMLPTSLDARNALHGLIGLAGRRISSYPDANPLEEVESMILKRIDRKNSGKGGGKIEGVTHWLQLPPLPGDSDWGDKPFEVIEELRLKPLDVPVQH